MIRILAAVAASTPLAEEPMPLSLLLAIVAIVIVPVMGWVFKQLFASVQHNVNGKMDTLGKRIDMIDRAMEAHATLLQRLELQASRFATIEQLHQLHIGMAEMKVDLKEIKQALSSLSSR